MGVASLKELRRLPQANSPGNAGGIVHAVIEPYGLPASSRGAGYERGGASTGSRSSGQFPKSAISRPSDFARHYS
jgi:hypothetical protein